MHQTRPIHPVQARKNLSRRFQKCYAWFLFAMVLAGVFLDKVVAADGVFVRGFVLGSVLGYIAQSLFFWINHCGRIQVASMSSMYLAVAVKWLVAFVGFAWIFWAIHGVSGLGVILGFFLMHMAMVVLVQYLARKV